MRFTSLFAVAVVVGVTLGGASVANAQQSAEITAERWIVPGNAPNDIALGGRFLFRIREGAGGLSRDARAAWVNNRLVTILGNTRINANDINWKSDGAAIRILVRGKNLITVTESDARAVNSTVPTLAKQWAGQLRRHLPSLHVLPTQTRGPVGERR